jgi:MFS family permease
VTAYALYVVTEYAMWIAVLVFAYANGGVTESGVVALAQLLPAMFAAPFFATLADRRSPKALLVSGYVAQGLGCAVVALAVLTDAPSLVVYVGAVWASVAMTTTRPAQAAMMPGLARDLEELTAANLIVGWAENLGIVAAGVVSGVLMTLGGVAPVAIFSAALSGVALFLVFRLAEVRLGGAGPRANAFRQVRSGVTAVLHDRAAGILVTLLGVEFVVLGALDVLFVLMAIDVLHHGEGWAGYLNSAHGAGGVAVGVLGAAIIGRRLGPVVVVTAGLMGLALAATAFVSVDALVLGLLALVGASRALFDIATRSLLQRVVAADMVARVFGLVEGLTLAGAAIGALLVPPLVNIGTGGARLALLVIAAIVPCVVVGRLRALLRIDEAAHVPVVEISLLRTTPVFRALPGPAMEGVARALQRIDFAPGGVVIRQGDEATQHYYVIADGVVQIQQDGHPVRELGRGSGVGEIALLHGGPRTASAVARTPVTLYSLDRESFLISLQGHAPSFSAAQVVADEYLAYDADRSGRPSPDFDSG